MVTQMIAVGEETGELTTMLNEIADFSEKEAGRGGRLDVHDRANGHIPAGLGGW